MNSKKSLWEQRLMRLQNLIEKARLKLERIREEKKNKKINYFDMAHHPDYKDSRCPKCSAFYIPFKKDFKCPKCDEPINEFYDLISETIDTIKYNKQKYGTHKPPEWPITSFLKYAQGRIFDALDVAEKNNFDNEEYVKFIFRRDNWATKEHERKHIEEIALAVAKYLRKEIEAEQIKKLQNAKTGQPITIKKCYSVIGPDGVDDGKRYIVREQAEEVAKQAKESREKDIKRNAFVALCESASNNNWCWKMFCTTCGHGAFKVSFSKIIHDLHPDDESFWPFGKENHSPLKEMDNHREFFSNTSMEDSQKLALIVAQAKISDIQAVAKFPDWLGYMGLVMGHSDLNALVIISDAFLPQFIDLVKDDKNTCDYLKEKQSKGELLQVSDLEKIERGIG